MIRAIGQFLRREKRVQVVAILIAMWKFIGPIINHTDGYVSFESRLFNYKQLLNEVPHPHPEEHLHGRLEYQMKDADLGR